jgi:hypothetical protein
MGWRHREAHVPQFASSTFRRRHHDAASALLSSLWICTSHSVLLLSSFFFSKGLVKSRPDDEPLVFRVARGSRVLEDHEHALVELCRNPDGGLGASEEQMEQCVNAFVQSTYDDFDDASAPVSVECQVVDGDEDPLSADCLLDSMYSMWAEDGVPAAALAPSHPTPDDSSSSRTKAKVKPWSSRSSPSGTYVRDPATGKLKNLDA